METCRSDDVTVRFVDEPEVLHRIFLAWQSEFGDREISVLDIGAETEIGRLLLCGRAWSAERLEWRLHWLRDLVAGDLQLVRVRTGKWVVRRIV
jgi:hypothetical protein